MRIKTLKVSKPFMYLWLKSVEGVDLSQHCARCLKGEYDNRISNSIESAESIELSSEVYYLCGVSKPYVWKNNFHLAFKKSDNESDCVRVSRNGVEIEIEGAVEIAFSMKDVDEELPQAKKAEFRTCRNWQFANLYTRGLR